MEDECHLLWGDCLGYVWGRTNKRIEVPIVNEKERQTFYGSINVFTKKFILKEYAGGNGKFTVDFLKYLQLKNLGKKIYMLWDGASYHKFSETREYLNKINNKLKKKDWKIECILFAPNAPEQNPVEDVWLQGKTEVRKNFESNDSFEKVKKYFLEFLNGKYFDLNKFNWYF
jgi:putative transposase